MSDKWRFYPYLLEQTGYTIGYTGKGWGPGYWRGRNAGRTFDNDNPAGHAFNESRSNPPYKGISNIDYAGNFESFTESIPDDAPFCFWMGVKEPHRGYGLNNWKLDNRDLSKVKVPAYLPDNETIRGDLADYAIEVEWFDAHIVRAIEHLSEIGKLDETIILATSDHGMPFPRVKGQIYDDGFHVPLAVSWPNKIAAGRTINDFVTFPDFAPTIMEVTGTPMHDQMTGRSFAEQLLATESGQIDDDRSYTILGKERHDIGRTDGELKSVAYPARAIRNQQYLYVRNFKPYRWPVGDPELGLLNCDRSPSKSYLTNLKPDSDEYRFYEMSFAKRPLEQLFDVVADPDCVEDLARVPEFRAAADKLWDQLQSELRKHGDPRILGEGDIFDFYPYANIKRQQQIYNDPAYDPIQIFQEKYNQKVDLSDAKLR